jgi:hypothetical protein
VLACARLLLSPLYYHPSRHSAGQPIIAGWAFQWIAQLSFARDSWTAPVDACRLHPLEDTDLQAARQIRALLARLPTGEAVPLFVFDAGYDSAQLILDLAVNRPGLMEALIPGMEALIPGKDQSMPRPHKYPPELRERATRMVFEMRERPRGAPRCDRPGRRPARHPP